MLSTCRLGHDCRLWILAYWWLGVRALRVPQELPRKLCGNLIPIGQGYLHKRRAEPQGKGELNP
jgi:hypothetical protein